MCYEIAKILGYPCAHIELAEDENGKIGILNYLFLDTKIEEHDDAISYINTKFEKRNEFYTIKNIKSSLDKITPDLFDDFLKIMVFDALVGETDRHEENWGIIKSANGYRLSPLYDNGCNLLRNFKNEKFASKYYNKIKSFDDYIRRSKSLIYKEDHKNRYNLIELIEYLYEKYPKVIKKEILNLDKLTDDLVEECVYKIPDQLLTIKHKAHIIAFLKERKKILKNIIEKNERKGDDFDE